MNRIGCWDFLMKNFFSPISWHAWTVSWNFFWDYATFNDATSSLFLFLKQVVQTDFLSTSQFWTLLMKLYNTLTTSRDLIINKSPVVWGHTTANNLPTHTSTKQTRTEQQSLGRICITSTNKFSKLMNQKIKITFLFLRNSHSLQYLITVLIILLKYKLTIFPWPFEFCHD